MILKFAVKFKYTQRKCMSTFQEDILQSQPNGCQIFRAVVITKHFHRQTTQTY